MSKKRTYKFVDLFAGCGGLSEGFMLSGHFEPIAHIEWEKPMVDTLRNRLVKKWGKTETEAQDDVVMFDIQRTDELLYGNWCEDSQKMYGVYNSENAKRGLLSLIGDRKVDAIIGGPPCQAYSIHGRATDKNSMQDDYRNYLFESFVKVVDALKPKVFIFENVTGMLSAKPGGTPVVNRIATAFRSIGYTILEPNKFKEAVFDAYDYNVPQHRKRVILLGIKNGEKFTLEDFYDVLSKSASESHQTVRDAIGDVSPIYPLKKIQKIRGRFVSHSEVGINDVHHLPRHCSERDLSVFKEWIENDMNHCSQREAIEFYKKVTGQDTLYRKYRNLEWDKPAPTVVAHLQKDGFMFIHPDIKQLRSITVREAALLMTFPMDYMFSGNRATCYKMIGNAVPVNFARAIAESLYRILN